MRTPHAPTPRWLTIVRIIGIGGNLLAAGLNLAVGAYTLMGVSAGTAAVIAAVAETLRRTEAEHQLRIRRARAEAEGAEHATALLAHQRAWFEAHAAAAEGDPDVRGPRH